MAEIRKHYPPPQPQESIPKPPPPPKRVYQDPGPAEATHNTVQLVKDINKLINDKLEQGMFLSYYYLYTEVFSAIKEKALEICQGNASRAAKLIGMKGTTFREAIRSKITPKERTPRQQPLARKTESPAQGASHQDSES